MNSKKTNWLVLICTFLLIVVFHNIINFSSNYIFDHELITGIENGVAISEYGIKLTELLYSNIKVFFIIQALAITIPNIVSAIENIKYKRLAICQFMIGIIGLINFIAFNTEDVLISNELLSFTIYTAIPILLMIFQVIILIRKKDDVEEVGIRKKVNIILFYILHLIITVALLLIVLSSLLLSKINGITHEKRINNLTNEIMSIDSFNNHEALIVVKNDGKYGFVDENGKEVIPCEYDMVSYFAFLDEEEKYSVALAKKDESFYIISKDNYKIEINDNVLNSLYYNFFERKVASTEELNNSFTKVNFFNFINLIYFRTNLYGTQNGNELDNNNEYELETIDSKYYYKNDNFSLEIEEVTEDDDYYFVILRDKQNNIVTSNEEYLNIHEGVWGRDNKIRACSDGSILFTTMDGEKTGWYDTDGNRHVLNAENENVSYEIRDIKDGKIIIQKITEEENDSIYSHIIIDTNGKILLEASCLVEFDNFLVTCNEDDNKFIMIDYDFNVISNEYDMINFIGNN